MKIVLFGADGQLGWELRRSLAPLGEVVALDRGAADFAQPAQAVQALRAQRPDAVVIAAAYTAVDRAESEVELAQVVNGETPGLLAREAAASGAWLVHYSTDYVFDGSGTAPRDERAPTAPLNAYGHSKLDGEERIRASGCRHLILRTSWVHAGRGQNFPRTMLKLAAERDQLRVIDDQVGAPTGADLLADVTAHALRAVRREPSLAGTYHVAAGGETSWHGYASFVVATARELGLPVRVAPQAIEAVPSNAFKSAARRPLNSRLDTRKLRGAFDLQLPPWQDGVQRLLVETSAAR